ncbi:hypothetical protein LOK49_LG01G04052 [Camellia lanceoleosa]|uniref:Uncharacterized protein n=1 Tax=Camellia lanceoleosa TaxID=1840588 RepID=A0ACC0IWD9_9ERIC|nr:hypothetical protein LOK49_LG01G04052 [Camellia lanceoleosa]
MVFDISTLQIFSSHELDYLFCCRRDSWEILMNEMHYVKPVATEAVQLTAKAHSDKSKEEVTAVNVPRIFDRLHIYKKTLDDHKIFDTSKAFNRHPTQVFTLGERTVSITPSTAHQLIQGNKRNDTICIALADDTCDQPKIRMNNVVITPSFNHR